ncbi:YoaK family protein [Sphingobium sp. C100]|uniref:YoaK family protein n=1 Tax=Sphingobium sp. C100 TaxID=1207055 RepID=UPI0004CF83CD|nr:DUF1275 family protein [Sphingobium sp. C100]
MHRQPPSRHVLAYGLAALAGMVDALGLLKLGGLFVSFMSGNSTRLAVTLTARNDIAIRAAGLIGAFLCGVVMGALAAAVAGRWRKQAVLALTLALLLLSACLTMVPGMALTLAMAAAMGAVNNVFQRNGEVSIGVTYMTGALVKAGQAIAATLTGGPRWGWLPHLLLWCSLIAGAVAGTALFASLQLGALWLACAWCLALLAWSFRIGPLPQSPA